MLNRCKHGLTAGSCAQCGRPGADRVAAPRLPRSSGGGITEVYRGFTIIYSPPPEREWSFRPEPGAKLQSYKSAFQARRAINELLDGESEVTPRRDSRALSGAASKPVKGSEWSDDELRASIDAYARMLKAEDRGAPLRKSDVVAEVETTTGRTNSSVQMRLQNISAVLNDHGASWIEGFKPLSHYPQRLAELIEAEYPHLLQARGR
jgi:hypothetical protein